MYKIASESNWSSLLLFYKKVYRKNHPLHFYDFWRWQYGDEKYGRSFIFLDDNQNVVGHVGATFGGGYAWIINVYLDEDFRGKGVLTQLYSMARKFYPLAATSANAAGLGLYRNMQWYRYCDLQRYVIINPELKPLPTESLVTTIKPDIEFIRPEGHYWQQPTLISHVFSDGSQAVIQNTNGGLRAVDIFNINEFVAEAWSFNYRWIDYVTSWNDKICKELERAGWDHDTRSKIPWKLDPLIKESRSEISYLSEFPVPKDFIVHRSFSDHGRIGSIDIGI